MDLTKLEEEETAREKNEQKRSYRMLLIVGIWAMQWTIPVCDLKLRFHTFSSILFRATSMSLMEGEDRDHKVVPNRDRQYDLKRKHLMNGSAAWNLQKKVSFTIFDYSNDVIFVIQAECECVNQIHNTVKIGQLGIVEQNNRKLFN